MNAGKDCKSVKKSKIFNITFRSNFTLKIILLTIVPAIIIVIFSLLVIANMVSKMKENISNMTTDTIDSMYSQTVHVRNHDEKEKIQLKIEGIENELNILRADVQERIDNKNENALDLRSEYYDWIMQHMEYHADGNWSNLADNELNVSISVWGYLHNKDGSIKQETEHYISRISPVLDVLQEVGVNGTKKGWYYVVGPKETPVMLVTPWAQMPELFDELYPGHNEQNWWDFFFPGMVESWQEWIQNADDRLNNTDEQVTLTPLYKDAGGTGLMITFFAPVWNKERTKNFGAAAVDYNIVYLTGMLNDEKEEKSGFTFLI
ncbi:MAG: phosphoserine phosphatase RsbU/P [Clostridiales bacterium]|nr:phosphoserine phosphatase RsbU/P [Clostridiales bacterium]